MNDFEKIDKVINDTVTTLPEIKDIVDRLEAMSLEQLADVAFKAMTSLMSGELSPEEGNMMLNLAELVALRKITAQQITVGMTAH